MPYVFLLKTKWLLERKAMDDLICAVNLEGD